jgi:hypothetical protein
MVLLAPRSSEWLAFKKPCSKPLTKIESSPPSEAFYGINQNWLDQNNFVDDLFKLHADIMQISLLIVLIAGVYCFS